MILFDEWKYLLSVCFTLYDDSIAEIQYQSKDSFMCGFWLVVF